MTTAISIKGLGKSYLLRHEQPDRYVALRDVLADGARRLGRRMLSPFAPVESQSSREVFLALRDINLEIKEGERVGIIGRNGAGKSTLLKILSRITEPSAGRIEIRGRLSSLLEVGTGFHPELTGRENIFLNGAILGMSHRDIRRRFDAIVEFAEIERFLDTPVKRYSSGMYVRLAFSVAAHLEPDILIVDEVLAVGDAGFQRKSLARMEDVAVRGGGTVVFVSHNMLAIQTLCSRAMLLERGRVVEDGPTDGVIGSYLRQSAEMSRTVLFERTDRLGDGRIRFASVTLRDRGGHPVHALRTGDFGVISIELARRSASALRRFSVAVGIDGQFGERITVLSSTATGDDFDLFPDDATSVDIHVDRLPLMPGQYRFTLYATVDGSIADWVQNAGLFDVEPGDFYRSGQLTPSGQGHFIVDCKFKPSSHVHESERHQGIS